MPSLAERLEAARRQQFEGRVSEREMIREALQADELPFVLLSIFGAGGVGKTSLLREAAYVASQLEVKTILLDGRELEPSPDSFLGTLQQQLNVPDSAAIFTTLAAQDGRFLLLLDTAELLMPLDSWLRETFLPQLPGNVLVIIAGRRPPSLRWRSNPGWQQLMRVLPLQNLSDEESRAFLMRRRVPAREHSAVLHFTHGHPLALSLVADVFAQKPETAFRPEEAPDIIKTLLGQFMQEAPSADHRAALEASSQVRLLNEPLLGEMLQVDDPHPVFEWLRGLSFMDADRRGLFPHDLAREAMAADLCWRNPAWQAELHDRARAFYMDRFSDGDARTQRQVLSDYIFLHRDNPVIRPYFEWQSSGTVFTDRYRDEDREDVLAMIGLHEGETAVRITTHWIERQQQGVVVFRQADRAVQGVLFLVSLEKTNAADRDLDPGTAAAWEYLAQYA
ncbi:MAG: ATP-binding protein, partial [Anaerolineae bacterium]